jgi:Ferritin-like domain
VSAPTLEAIDRDEALTDAIAALCGSTRAGFLRGTALGGAAMLAALAAPASASARINDVAILNFGLRFERLQATFYTQADEVGTIATMTAAKRRWAQTLGAHERAHVKIIKDVLGPKAEGPPTFDFGDANETGAAFTRTAVAMEDLTVGLLTGVAPRIEDRALLAAFMGLLTVEARHAAWARNIVRADPSPRDFDEPRSLASVSTAIRRTNFVVQEPRTSASRRAPRFTG